MINNVVLLGRMTAEPELRTTPGGTAVCSFRMAVERDYTRADGARDVDFISVVVWRKTAEFLCKYFHKGSWVGVSGSLRVRQYVDKDGVKRTVTEVLGGSVSFAGETVTAAKEQPCAVPVGEKSRCIDDAPTAELQTEPYLDIPPISDEDLPF